MPGILHIKPVAMERPRKVLIMEDHDIVASTIASIAKENIDDVSVIKTHSFTGGLRLLNSGLEVDLIVLDVYLPGGESYAMIQRLREAQPGVRILVFTGGDEDKHALHFLSAGANGFLSKNAPMEEVGVAIRMVMSEKTYMAADVQQHLADRFFKKAAPPKPEHDPGALSPRENEVLSMLLDGRKTTEIATSLRLKLTTVSTHKARIFSKLGVTNLIELFKRAKERA